MKEKYMCESMRFPIMIINEWSRTVQKLGVRHILSLYFAELNAA